MARLFDDASSEYLVYAGAPPALPPSVTMACWFNSDDVTANQTLLSCADASETSNYMRLMAGGALTGDVIRAQVLAGLIADSALNANADTSTGFSANTWHHAAAVFTDNGDVTAHAYIDGGSKGSESRGTGWVNTDLLDRTAIGVVLDSTPNHYTSGMIAEPVFYNIGLSDEEVALLAKAVSPLMVRPEAIVAYWPLIGRTSPEIDLVGGYNLTLSGTTAANHPRVIYPAWAQVPMSVRGFGLEAIKRSSATAFLLPSYATGSWPYGTISQDDRQAVSWMYAGILATGAAAAGGFTPRSYPRGVLRGVGRGVA